MKCKLHYSRVHGQIHLADFIALSKCPLEGWIFGAKRATNGTPPPKTPELKAREESQSGF